MTWAWQNFNSGTPEDLTHETLNMADYKQNAVIANKYNEMNGRRLTGAAFTLAMSIVGTPSIPGAQSYSQANPLILHPTPESVSVSGRLESIIEQQVSDQGYQDAVDSNLLTSRWDEILAQFVIGDGNPFDGK